MAVLFAQTDLIEFSSLQINDLKHRARQAPLRRARLCLHLTQADQVQEMVVALCHDSYCAPHRHSGKSESLHMIEGELLVALFDENGQVERRLRLGGAGQPFLYRLARNQWHMPLALSEVAVFHEAIGGPFIQGQTDLAPWAPNPQASEAIRSYVRTIAGER